MFASLLRYIALLFVTLCGNCAKKQIGFMIVWDIGKLTEKQSMAG
ncbi:hypothetical protein yruck0001_15920 [Yersinia ruckeri ATCC 29473]|uniref:Uncharacterized protein n=1 Tax=Yersinia ruckeri TaxID=29486 RepID=A0A0A8VHF3_YERRU|nr:hypothetical protein yruck0001_15920 [Yersinia ruckeri ATCC 29473]CEK27404.1 hypothetical protein CSF007_8250 [Yersinia ruckeri]